MIAKVLERAVASLGLDAPLHPWWLGEARPRRPVRRSRVLASPCPSAGDVGCDVELEARLLDAFLTEDRETIAGQIDDGYEQLIVLDDDPQEHVDEASVVHVRLGLPLIGRDRVLLRVCARNLYDDARTVTADYHAWLDRAGSLPKVLTPPQRDLAALWPRWVVGRSPGLRVGANTASESELLDLPGMTPLVARAILARRPFADLDQLAEAIGAETLRAIRRHIDV